MTDDLSVPLHWPGVIHHRSSHGWHCPGGTGPPKGRIEFKVSYAVGKRWYIQQILSGPVSEETTVFSKTFSKQNSSNDRGVIFCICWCFDLVFYVSMWQIVSSWGLQGTPQLALTWNSLWMIISGFFDLVPTGCIKQDSAVWKGWGTGKLGTYILNFEAGVMLIVCAPTWSLNHLAVGQSNQWLLYLY